jgi:hypothetical protein
MFCLPACPSVCLPVPHGKLERCFEESVVVNSVSAVAVTCIDHAGASACVLLTPAGGL